MGSRAPIGTREISPAARTPCPLKEGLAVIEERLSAARRVAVMLDFDGTLAAITLDPGGAHLDPEVRKSLLTLSAKAPLAVISGRALDDLRIRVGLPGLIYAGCHGLEIHGPGFDFVEPATAKQAPALKLLAERLTERLRRIDGVKVEDKGLAVSVHYRQVAQPDRREIEVAVPTETARSGDQFQVRRGKEVWEISIAVNWHKGRAARWILNSTGNGDALPLYIGDDVTDEDAFRELQEGITIKVGQATTSFAEWTAAGPREVHSFLGWLESRLP